MAVNDWLEEEANRPRRNSPWIPLWQAAQRLAVSESTLYKYLRNDPTIRTWKISRKRLVHEGDIELILATRRTEHPT